MASRGGRKRRAEGRATSKRRPATRATPKPALGNDPFTRGAAPRAPALPLPPEAATPPPPEPPDAVAPIELASPEPTADPTSPAPSSAPSPAAPAPEPAAKVRLQAAHARVAEVERRLESALGTLEERLGHLAAQTGVAGAGRDVGDVIARLLPALRERLSGVLDLARLLEPPERLDRHGMDPRLVERAEPVVELLYASWWRTRVHGVERVPAEGPALVVANHAGLVPWDALVLRHALRREHPSRRELRPLLDDRECDLPLVGRIAVRLGAVRSSPEAAGRILAEGGVLGVFPEGSAGARKPWSDRYRIARFGRGGFVRVALRARAPIVPCAIVGSEEASPGISRPGWLADRLGIPFLSANPYLRLGPAAVVPLPSRWSLHFGEPVDVSRHAPEDAEDPALVSALTDQVRESLQSLLDEGLAARGSVFL